MKATLKLESLGILLLYATIYFYLFPNSLGFYIAFFFIPDISSFLPYLISKKIGTISYNIFHHQGLLVMFLLLGFFIKESQIVKIGLIFLSHSAFDRALGYGLKYFDSFDHTHLGWIGKSKNFNKE